MSKILYFDSETTGLDIYINDIIQIAGIIIIDGKVEQNFKMEMKPFNPDNIDAKAVATHGITKEMMMEFPDPKEQKLKFTRMLDKYVNKYERTDKFIAAGYNIIKFDIPFVDAWFQKADNDEYLFSYLAAYQLDLYPTLVTLHYLGVLPRLENFQLPTVAKYYGLEYKAHDAFADIEVTRKVLIILNEEFKKLRKTI